MEYSAFFFDFDGVLADSAEVKTMAFCILFKSFGPHVQNMVVDHHRENGDMTAVLLNILSERCDIFQFYMRLRAECSVRAQAGS